MSCNHLAKEKWYLLPSENNSNKFGIGINGYGTMWYYIYCLLQVVVCSLLEAEPTRYRHYKRRHLQRLISTRLRLLRGGNGGNANWRGVMITSSVVPTEK